MELSLHSLFLKVFIANNQIWRGACFFFYKFSVHFDIRFQYTIYRTGTALSDSTQKNAFTDDSPSASEDDDDAVTDTVNEGSKHIVLGDKEAEERIQRARDARKEFFESEHNTTVESYSSKRDDFENEDEQSDNEDILMDDPPNISDHDEKDKSVIKANTSDVGKANKLSLVEEMAQSTEEETHSQNKQETGPLDSKDNKYSRTAKKQQEQIEEPDKRQEAVKSGKSRTGSGDQGARSGKGRRESGGKVEEPGTKSVKGRRESGGSCSRSGANSSSSASEGNKQ